MLMNGLKLAAILVLTVSVVGCDDGGGEEEDTAADGSSGAGDDTGGGSSFEATVLPVIQEKCDGAACHRGGGTFPPILEDDNAYDNLLAGSNAMAGDYVVPGDSNASFLWNKVSSDMPEVGVRMPYMEDPLSQAELDAIQAWIDSGAGE